MGAIRVLDRNRLARIVVVAAALLVVAGLGTLAWGGPMGNMLRYSVARPCPADAPSSDCVATLPATVISTWTDYSELPETLVSLDVPGAPAGAARNPFDGDIEALISQADAERLRVEETESVPDPVDRVEVTMFDGMVLTVTGAGGETAATSYTLMPKLAVGQYVLLVLVASGVLAGAVSLWRRGAVRRSSWLGPAVGSAFAGAFVGLVATVVTSGNVAPGWTVPILGIAVLVMTPLVAFLSARRLREPFAAQVND
jgi:hypothetical protein